MGRHKEDLSGKRVGRLLVVCEDPRNRDMMICECECGNRKSILRRNLLGRGSVHSCGCLAAESHRASGLIAASNNFNNHYSLMRKYHTIFGAIANDKPPKNNKSGHKGVWFDPKRGTYVAYICLNHHKYHLGSFSNIADAIQARKEAEELYYAPLIAQRNSEIIHSN